MGEREKKNAELVETGFSRAAAAAAVKQCFYLALHITVGFVQNCQRGKRRRTNELQGW